MTGCKSNHSCDIPHQLFTHFPRYHCNSVWAFVTSSVQSTRFEHWRQNEISQRLLYERNESSVTWEATSFFWCKKNCVNRPVQLFYHSGKYALHRCWPRDANQLKSEAADHQVSGLGSCKERRWAVLGSFNVDRLCTIFLSSIERTFLFIRQTQPFLKRFCKQNIFECFQENCPGKVTRAKSWGQKRRKC